MRNTFKVLFLHQEECAFTQWKHADHGTHYDQRTANAAVHATIRESNLWDVSMGRAAGAQRGCLTCQRTTLADSFPHRKMLQHAVLRACPGHSENGQRRCISATTSATKRCWPSSGSTTKNSAVWWASAAAKRPTINIGVFTSISKNYVNDKFNRKGFAVQRTRQRVPDGVSPLHRTGVRTQRKNTTWIYMIALKHILMLARSKGIYGQGYLCQLQITAANS